MQKLPIGKQSFESIIKSDYLYVDKTKQIYDLITGGEIYFLSRPRRFGKSLLCSTIKAIFQGKKELFKNLWIYDSDYKWPKHPIIHIDMSLSDRRTPKDFEESLHDTLEEIARDYKFEFVHARKLFVKFQQLIKELEKKHGQVVIIIDEYDKPIVDHLDNTAVASKMRVILHDFYSMLKPLDEYIKFIFITGVSRFAKTTIFSGLNNLLDISMDEETHDIVGYTQKDIEASFANYFELAAQKQKMPAEALLEKIKYWYNGYRFAENAKTIYNPFSILLFCKFKKFENYWFETGTPTFLYNTLKDKICEINLKKDLLEGTKKIELGRLSLKKLSIKTLLYQTGYLTIKDYDQEISNYYLDFPNKEVEESLLEGFIEEISSLNLSGVDNIYLELADALKNNDLQKFFDSLYFLFTQINYPIRNTQNEEFYQVLFYWSLKVTRIKVATEVPTNRGRIDMIIETKTHIYILELKVNKSADIALQQIEKKKYHEKFLRNGKPIVLVGINFDTNKHNINEWKSNIIED